jgi:hypothetical protein
MDPLFDDLVRLLFFELALDALHCLRRNRAHVIAYVRDTD